MAFTKITQDDLANKGVIGLPDTPNLSTQAMQEKLDEIATDVIVPKFNNLCDELDDCDIESKIGSPNITNLRLNADLNIEYSDDDGETYAPTASSGHRIMNGSGSIYPQRSRMQFSDNVTITDDEANNKTVLMFTGIEGPPGKAATITVGNVEEGDDAEVTNTGSATDAILNFTLPKGDDGSAATISVGTVTSGQNASVINSGTSSAAIFNFVLPKGDQGDPGTGLTLLGQYDTLADLQSAHPTGNRGDAYFVGDEDEGVVYLWNPDTTAWTNVGTLKGAKGDTGATPSFSIGTVTSGQIPAVTIGGTTDYPTLNFVLEPGDKGDTGNAGTIAVGTVTSGQTASVTNSGTATAAVFDFVLPKGDKGNQGDPTTVNGKSGNSVTLYGTDIYTSDAVSANTISADLTTLSTAVSGKADTTTVNNKHKVTTLPVDLQNWTSDTTSQSGTTLYKKSINLSHVYVDNPSVDIGASGVLPTTAQQEAYDLLQYVTIDGTTLYLYASDIPTTAFYINVEGCD
jgi:hypothetical protein